MKFTDVGKSCVCIAQPACSPIKYIYIFFSIFFLVGEILATYEENTRDFLFPDPKVTRGNHGSDREILMKRSFSFTVSASVYCIYDTLCYTGTVSNQK